MKTWKQWFMALAVVGIGVAALPAQSASAINVFEQCSKNADSSVCKAQDEDKLPDMVKILINTALTVLGMVAVLMIVIGGVRYTTSNGESSAIKSAKDTILYAVVGLVVAILSFAIVNFVVGAF